MPDLLPCPFCGEIPTDFQADEMVGGKWGAVVCRIRGPEVRTHYGPVDVWRDAAIAAWNQRAGWRDIASAPKDGTQILAYLSYGDYLVAWWTGTLWRDSWGPILPKITLWHPIQPLPEPPKEGGAK